jgi:ATP-binding cassette subfamily B protein
MRLKNSKNALLWIFKYSKSNLPWVVLLSVITGIISFGYIYLALVSKQVLDIATKDIDGSLLLSILEIAGIIILQCVLNIVYANIFIRADGRMDVRIKQGLFSKLLGKKWQNLNEYHSGEIINRFTSDVDTVIDGILNILPTSISLLTRLIAGLWVLFAIDWRFTIAVIALGVVIFIAGKIYSKHFKYLHKELQSAHGVVRSFIQECFENIMVIKSFANDDIVKDRLLFKQKNMLKLMYKKQSISNVANTGVYMLFTGSYYIALIWGALNISMGVITFGTLTAFLQILDQIKGPMANISGLIPKFYSMTASAERLMELENLPDEKELNQLENISFSYKNDLVLSNASAVIEKGELVAIAGPSGIGKSTLMKLFLGLIEPKNGSIFFDTTSGKIDITSGTRRMFSYVPQGNFILSGTIKENISFASPNATDEQIENAAKNAVILDFINSLPDKMETIVGERGLGLSEGQIQRIAVARALLSDAPILLLDEATSALDEHTEKKLIENIKSLHNKTCIFISHKPSTISMCDRIISFNNKKLVPTTYDEIAKSWK